MGRKQTVANDRFWPKAAVRECAGMLYDEFSVARRRVYCSGLVHFLQPGELRCQTSNSIKRTLYVFWTSGMGKLYVGLANYR